MKCSAVSTMPNVGQPRIPSDNKSKSVSAFDNKKMLSFVLFVCPTKLAVSLQNVILENSKVQQLKIQMFRCIITELLLQ